MKINLADKPIIVQQPSSPLLYVEKIGPFMVNAPVAWREFWSLAGGKVDQEQMAAMVGLSRIDPSKIGDAAYVYQAGVMLKSRLAEIPKGLQLRNMAAGKYAAFLLTGSYSQFSEAYPRIFSILSDMKLKVRDDFCIESYLNSPADTQEKDLKTSILIPID